MAEPAQHADAEAAVDLALVRRVRAGEIEVFAELLARHRAYVFRIVARHVPAGRVEDVAQEVFVDAYRSLARFAGASPFRHWLAAIAVRRCHDFWRHAGRHPETPASAFGERPEEFLAAVSAAATGADGNHELDRRQRRELLDWALAHLGADDRLALSLVHLDERPVREAAALLGWSESNVKVRAHRARHTLRQLLSTLVR